MIKKIISSLAILMILTILFFNMDLSSYSTVYIPKKVLSENGSQNMVSAIVLDYRLYDSLLEVIVFTLAVFGVSFFLKKIKEVVNINSVQTSVISISTPIIFILIVMLSFYVIVTGHISPGGGFTAGVIMGTGLIGVSFVKPMDEIEKIFEKSNIEKFKILTPIIIIIYGFCGYFWGDAMFQNIPFLGKEGNLLSGGSAIFLNFLIGFEVFAGTWTILYKFIKHRGMLL